MSLRLAFAGIAVLAALAGTALWFGTQPSRPGAGVPASDATPAAIYAASFLDSEGSKRSLAQFQGKVLVVNFWATWCGPCREEMPGFVQVQRRWAGKEVQFLGLAHDDPEKVRRFGAELGINYPLWTGGSEVMELSRRLGNRLGVLPHTVVLDAHGQVLESRVGLYPEPAIEDRLLAISSKRS